MTSQERNKIIRQSKCCTAGSRTTKEESWSIYYLDFITKLFVLRSRLGVLLSFYLQALGAINMQHRTCTRNQPIISSTNKQYIYYFSLVQFVASCFVVIELRRIAFSHHHQDTPRRRELLSVQSDLLVAVTGVRSTGGIAAHRRLPDGKSPHVRFIRQIVHDPYR